MNESTSQRVIPFPAEPVPAEFDLLCEQCGYSLVGLIDSNRCPECGKDFNPNELPLARVPWLYRLRLGWWRAYWSTVRLILADPRTFATDLCRPVRISAEDAARFRAVTGRVAAITTFLAALVGGGILAYRGSRDAFVAIPLALGLLVGVRLFVHIATDMPTFIWRGSSDRNPHELSPLQHYASAPVALIGVPACLVGALLVVHEVMPNPRMEFTVVMLVLAIVIGAILPILFLWVSVVFMRVATGCSRRRAAVLALYLPAHWLMIGVVCWALTFLIVWVTMVVCMGVVELLGRL